MVKPWQTTDTEPPDEVKTEKDSPIKQAVGKKYGMKISAELEEQNYSALFKKVKDGHKLDDDDIENIISSTRRN